MYAAAAIPFHAFQIEFELGLELELGSELE